MKIKELNPIYRYREEILKLETSQRKYVVFLCGPSIKKRHDHGAILRRQLKKTLEINGFDVVLGEDDGLEDVRINSGNDAQTNEIMFISSQCSEVIIIASSPGSFCELGAFTACLTMGIDKKKLRNKGFILIISDEHEGQKSFVNSGPAKVIDCYTGKVHYESFKKFEVSKIIDRLKHRRVMYFQDMRGRKRKEG